MKSAAEWARIVENDIFGCPMHYRIQKLVEALDAYARQQVEPLEAELRRLREELDQCHSDAGFVIPALREALAAHQAVVRDMHICFEVLKDLWHKTNRTMADLEAGQRTIERGLALAVWGNEI